MAPEIIARRSGIAGSTRRIADLPESGSLILELMEVLVTPDGPAGLDRRDVRVGDAYERVRGDERHRVAELKRSRRVHLGGSLALVFENRDTIRAALEEALRTERLDDPDRVADEIGVFNAAVPEPGELAAMLFVEVADPADLAAAAARLEGVERTVFMEVAGARVRGVPEVVSPPGEVVPAHYLRFSLEPGQRAAVRGGSAIAIGTDHPNLTASVQLDEEQRRAIAAEL
ncbi:MAG: DUF3501 family protein [Candidatus Dormibacteria bacterium]